jgi:hypothetical protein
MFLCSRARVRAGCDHKTPASHSSNCRFKTPDSSRPTVSQPYQARVWGPCPGFCWCGAPSLTIGRICHLQLLLAPANTVILRPESRGTHDHTLLSHIRDFPNLEGQVPVFISPRNRVARLYTQALGSLFVASYVSQGYGGVSHSQHPTTQLEPPFTTNEQTYSHCHTQQMKALQ